MLIINDETPDRLLYPTNRGRGLDLSARPEGFAYGGTAEPFPDSMLIPKSEWQARIQEMEERKSRLSDLCRDAGLKCKDQAQTNYCVPAGTMIRMADGSETPIQDVKVLDEVVTAEGNVKKVTRTMVRRANEPLFTLILWEHAYVPATDEPYLRATGEHPILTKRGYVCFFELEPGDKVAFPRYAAKASKFAQLQDETHVWRKVYDIESRPFDGYVFNLEVEDDHSYVAAGVGVHNCWVNAPTYCVEVVRTLENERPVILSPASVGAQVTGYRNQGGWGKSALEWITRHGIVPVDKWPPNAISRQYATDDNIQTALDYRVDEWWELEPGNINQLVSALLRRFPVAVGLAWWSHEVSYIDACWVDGDIAIRFRNSWGLGYGTEGYGILQGRKILPDDAVCPRTTRAS
jgi:hypothetical protein